MPDNVLHYGDTVKTLRQSAGGSCAESSDGSGICVPSRARTKHLSARLLLRAGVIALLVLACSQLTGPVECVFELDVGPVEEASVEVVSAAIILTGEFVTTCAPYSLEGAAERLGQKVTVTVYGRFVNGCPLDVVEEHTYRANVSGLAAGTYDVRLVHDREEAVSDTTVLERRIVVQ